MSDATRDDFLPLAERNVSRYYANSLGKHVWLQTLTQQEAYESGAAEDTVPRLIIASLVSESGSKLFSAQNPDDLRLWQGMRASVCNELIDLINKHSNVSGTIAEAVGNSDASQND